MSNPSVWRAAACALIASTVAPTRAGATIHAVTVSTTRDYENARGFTYAEITVPERDRYVKRVKRAADHLAVRGYITNTDRTALIAAAEREPLPEELQCRK